MLNAIPPYDGGDVRKSKLWWMHDLLGRVCAEHGIEFIDLTGAFREQSRTHGLRLESTYDAYWNEIGHRVAAEELHKTLVATAR